MTDTRKASSTGTFTGLTVRRKPRGYVGTNHETIGSDIQAVLRATPTPSRILDQATLHKLEQVRTDDWYPIEWLLSLMDQVYAKVGDAGLRKMGRELFKLSHAAQVRANVKSARDLLIGFDGLYHFANRGHEIGGWKVLAFGPGSAEMEKTTPHHCIMEEGIMIEALGCVGTPAVVSQRQCMREGADACRFVIQSAILDARWSGQAA